MAQAPTVFSTWPSEGRPAGYFPSPIGEDAAAFYRENGFLVVEDSFTDEQIEALNHEAAAICRGDRGREISGLLPAEEGESDEEVLRRHLCIHFPNKASELMHKQAADPALTQVLTRIIGPNVKCMQVMLFIKAAGKPGQAWHQDEIYIPTRDRSLTGCWIAMDDATVENGCLWVIPGSQRHGILWPMEWHDDRRFDCAWESQNFPYTDEDAVPVEVKKGSVVYFNGYLLHRSLPNQAQGGFRRALVNHYMSAESLLPWLWPDKPTGMGEHDFRDIFLVAGTDPYAHKGIENRSHAHVRASGEGGCNPDYSPKD